MRKYISLFVNYLQYERNYSAYTVEAYTEDLCQFVCFLESKEKKDGDVFSVERIDADVVREWMMLLMKQSLSPVSVNRKLSSLRSFFKYLIRQKIVSKNPLMFVLGPKKHKALPYFLKEKEMEEVLDENKYGDSFEGIRDLLIMELFYETGIRRSELVGIKNCDVDFGGMVLKVTGKRNKQRLIPFADRLKDLMEQYINVRKRDVGVESEYFFLRRNGQQLSPFIVYYIVKKKLSSISTLLKRSPHVLRHTFATSMLNDGAKISSVKDLLGHSSLASTSVYTHVTFEELKKMYHAHPRAQK